jgi:uncharacterized protein YjbI with pentapeptide repeats
VGANLNGADFTGADLLGARMSSVLKKYAIFCDARMPNGERGSCN